MQFMTSHKNILVQNINLHSLNIPKSMYTNLKQLLWNGGIV